MWKDMIGHPKFIVSDTGEIANKSTGKIYAKTINHEGYYQICLCESGRKFVVKCHREVAKAFIPAVKGKNIVNHIDGNKLNNSVKNLEWCTISENALHAVYVTKSMAPPVPKRKRVLCLETGIVYESLKDAVRRGGAEESCLRRCCKKIINTHHGYHWEFV